ncbi:hypothetical protein T484DRAFT_1835329 [Baffinella frigidus]|nr:hypothetical protein T484DRAFT_1835329 [Cryptophyta sp. CCMP2293]
MATIGTIGKFLALRPFSYFSFFREFSVVDRFLWETVGVDDPSSDHAGLAKGYNLWVAKVKAEVPADKLLVHDASVNEAAELERVVAFLEVVTTWWAWIAVGVYAALAMVAFGVWRLLASWMGGGGKVKGE